MLYIRLCTSSVAYSTMAEVIVDEMEHVERQHEIEDALYVAYAQAIGRVMPSLINQKCYGCGLVNPEDGTTYDHPSQLHHNVCTMMTREEQIDFCFEEALALVHDKEMLFIWWFEDLAKMTPLPTLKEYGKYLCKGWRVTHWITPAWKEEMKDLVHKFY